MRTGERSVAGLPLPLLAGFVLAFIAQLLMHQFSVTQASREYRPLSKPFDAPVYAGLSLGSHRLMSYLLSIRLQLHDNQAGRHVRYDRINYHLLIEWLDQISQLNRHSEYPMMLASRIYSQTQDKSRLRNLLEFIDDQFTARPQLHWRRQAEATVIAKHQLGDLELALEMAKKLAGQPDSIQMPHWARDMQFLLLGDLNEFETAMLIIQALLQSGSITDPDELRFLKIKLLYFQQKLSELKQKSIKIPVN